jgi:hypothetical protein
MARNDMGMDGQREIIKRNRMVLDRSSPAETAATEL